MRTLRPGVPAPGTRRAVLLLLVATGAACDGRATEPTAVPAPLLSAGASSVPAAPMGAAAAVTSLGMRVTWTHPGTDETSFAVARRVQQSGAWGAWEDRGTAPAADSAHWDDRDAPANRVYHYRVRACNAAGCSAWTYARTVARPAIPAPPASLLSVPFSETALRVHWTDASSNETSFRIFRQRVVDGVRGPPEPAGTAAANTTSLPVRGLVTGEEYLMRVSACNVTGCSAMSWARPVVMPYVPANPVEPSAERHGPHLVFVGWRDPGQNATRYTVDRSVRVSPGIWLPYQNVASIQRPGIFFPDGPLSPGAYRYRIRACNLAGCSPGVPTPVASVPVPIIPVTP